MNNKCGVLSFVWLSHEQYHPNEFYFLPLIASIPSSLELLSEVASYSSIKLNAFFLEHSSRVSRKIYSFELCSNIVYDIFNLFVGDYRPWLKYAHCRWRAREIMFNCIYADRWCIFSSNCFIQKELNTLNWYAFSSFIIHTLNAWSLCRSTGMWLNWISLNYIALWFVNELERNYLLIYNSSTGTWWPTETVWRSLCRRLDYPNAALQ